MIITSEEKLKRVVAEAVTEVLAAIGKQSLQKQQAETQPAVSPHKLKAQALMGKLTGGMPQP